MGSLSFTKFVPIVSYDVGSLFGSIDLKELRLKTGAESICSILGSSCYLVLESSMNPFIVMIFIAKQVRQGMEFCHTFHILITNRALLNMYSLFSE